MNVVVTSDHRFSETPDGQVWTSGINSYEFWKRYLAVFDGVRVLARVRLAPEPDPGNRTASGPGVTFAPLPNYSGPWQFLREGFAVRGAIRRYMAGDGAVILRVSSHIGGCAESFLRCMGRPYGVEVVNDPFDVYAPGAVQYRLRSLFRWHFVRQLQRQCRNAAAAAYVTDRALQRRYPCPSYSAGISDVEIGPEAIVSSPRSCDSSKSRGPFRLVTVSSLAQMYKAPDVLLRAVAECIHTGLDLTLAVVGGGKHEPAMERLAFDLGIKPRVLFLGQLPAGAAVRDQLDASDLFILASRCEGLPRAMVEAMARALPCIGSDIGGIPELLSPEDLAPPGDVAALAAKIREVLRSPERLSEMSTRNLQGARRYADERLAQRRIAFLETVRHETRAWAEHRGRDATACVEERER